MKPKNQISWWATGPETERIHFIRDHYQRPSLSDTVRFLVNSEFKKILDKNNAITTKPNQEDLK